MPKIKDEKKRRQILNAACTLFARNGFANTSIAHISAKTRLPIGSVYTYFSGKEEIISTIVDDGWKQLKSRLEIMNLSDAPSKKKLSILISEILPDFLENADFINILLSECVKHTKIEKKAAELSTLLTPLFNSLKKKDSSLNKKMFTVSMLIYILGSLESIRLLRKSSLKINIQDIVGFIRHSAESLIKEKLD